MKKIDILNYITDSRKSPNQVKTYHEILTNVAQGDELSLFQLLNDLKQTKVLRETELNGQKAYQVISR